MRAAWERRIGPESGAAQLARTLALPAELLVPFVRAARGYRGVALMPAAVGQGNAVAAAALVGMWRRAGGGLGESSATDQPDEPLTTRHRAVVLGALGWCVVSPFFAARSARVVLAERSPLWAYPLQGLLTVPVSIAMVTALITVIRQARDDHRQGIAQPSEPDVNSTSQ
jgi:hypothetical protein